MQSYIIKCQSSPVDILNIIKKEFPKLLKFTISLLSTLPDWISWNSLLARMANMKNSSIISESTLNIAGNIRIVVYIKAESPLNYLISLNTLVTLNTLNILAI